MTKFLPKSRLARVACIVVALTCILGGVAYRKFFWKKSRLIDNPLANVNSVPLSHAQYMDVATAASEHVLDYAADRWSKVKDAPTFKAPEPWTFSANQLPTLSEAEIAAFKERHPLVRPIPYPYFRCLSIPSDCCATRYCDVLYCHTFLSRQYGIDGTSSFFPFSSAMNCSGDTLAIFDGRSLSPRLAAITLEGQTLDQWPMLLTFFHRGWIDHLHSWSNGDAVGYSLFEPTTVAVVEGNKCEKTVEPHTIYDTTWEGIALDLEVTKEVESFSLCITDHASVKHWIVYGEPLQNRSGWELKTLPAEGKVYFHLADERLKTPLGNLGRHNEGRLPFKSINFQVRGKKDATLRVNSLQLFDLTRAQIIKHMETMKRYNIFPVAYTYHGGCSNWANCVPLKEHRFAIDIKNHQDKAVKVFSENCLPLGATAGAPAYHSDLLAQFGCRIFVGSEVQAPFRSRFPDGTPAYVIKSRSPVIPEGSGIPKVTAHMAHFDDLGGRIAAALLEAPQFEQPCALYTHFNFYNATAFEGATQYLYLEQVKKLHPYVEEGLKLLSNCKYNLDGKRRFSDRVWVCPIGVQGRFFQAQRKLKDHAKLQDDVVSITPWVDDVTKSTFPDPNHVTQDLHGQTFYVSNAQKTRVIVGEQEITSLTRNPKDFTGRESVTIISTDYPTSILDEVDFYERNGRVVQEKASSYFVTHESYTGKRALEVELEADGSGNIAWEPMRLNTYETDYLRFAYKKRNPDAKIWIELVTVDGQRLVATEGELQGRQGWKLAPWSGPEFREVVLDFAEMQMPAKGTKIVPRQKIRSVRFGMDNGKAGDSVFFDRVEFLSARGNRTHSGKGLIIGGQLKPGLDGEVVTMRVGKETREVATSRGGWYIFHDVPVDAVVEVFCEQDGVRYRPLQGRLMQAVRNDMEQHINMNDPRCPSTPRPKRLIGMTIPDAAAPRAVLSQKLRDQYGSYFDAHSMRYYAGIPKQKWCYIAEDSTNNYGFIDRDRRFENKNKALRIVMHGECWTEGAQTYTGQHMNMLLESILSRETGVPVEVIVTATSSSSPASYALDFEKYGTKFQPDFTFVFLNQFNIIHLEPTLQMKMFGWKKENPPYQMFDFDAEGKLVSYPPDPTFAAFIVPPDAKPLVGEVPLYETFLVNEVQHPLVDRSFMLLKAIVKERYLDRMQSYDGNFGIIYGYDFRLPPYATKRGAHTVSADRWNQSVRKVCEELHIHGVDLSPHLRRDRSSRNLLWENDDHLTPLGHERFAQAIAREILSNPAFQARVHARRGIPVDGVSRPKKPN